MTSTRTTALLAAAAVVIGLSVASPAAGAPRVEMLPNLVPFAPTSLFGPQTGLVPSFGYGYPAPPVAIAGCLPDEIARKNVSRCLRFETVVANQGPGAFELTFRIEAPQPGAYQVIYARDGSTRSRFAAPSEYHPTHHHFHLPGFYEARLWRAGSGRASGSKPVAVGEKSGFCPEDGARESGGSDPRYRCLGDYRAGAAEVGQVVGISAGWSDAYRMHLPDQFIDIAGVDDGSYLLQITIDPAGHIREADEHDNDACVLISLEGENASIVSSRVECPVIRA